MTKEYNFTLTFDINENKLTAKEIINRLNQSGCTDFTPILDELPNKVTLEFNKVSTSLTLALEISIEDIKKAFPNVDNISIDFNIHKALEDSYT